MIHQLLDFALGPCVRNIKTEEKTLFLTFDDGPDPLSTPAVLDVLAQYHAPATFFLIADRAEKAKNLLARIQADGHTIGNHSINHDYGAFFNRAAALKTWVEDAEKLLQDLTGHQTVGFRPPAGVRTPPLRRVLYDLKEPLVLWSMRYFDGVKPWKEKAALASVPSLSSGDIVLLHDRQTHENLPIFLKTLNSFLQMVQNNGFQLRSLRRQDCITAMKDSSYN